MKSFSEHPRLLEWIKEEGFNRITFSGGEPLMYFPIIKRYMEALGTEVHYRMMSNGTLLTKEIAEFFNLYKVTYCVSYDGKCGGRDLDVPIQWHNLQHLNDKGSGLCTVFSSPEFSFRAFAKEVEHIKRKYGLVNWVEADLFKINWVHQTKDAPNEAFTQEVADRYITQVTNQLDKALYCFSIDSLPSNVIKNLLHRWYSTSRITHGVVCCNEQLTSVNLDGTIMKCPYGTDVIGTIDNPPSYELMDSFIPEKCKSCEHWEICRCECVASVTGLDCYVNRTMIPVVKQLISKHGVEDKIFALFNKNP